MHSGFYSRLKDVGMSIFCIVGFFAALIAPVAFPNSDVAWLACGLYFGWLGTYIWHRAHELHRLNA